MSQPRIQVLPEMVANLIAAGEVVERPASVVKELIENALDAGARQITVAIDGAGAHRIEVADDGVGMLPADATLAFQRHATSKVSVAEDLNRILTLGFRGEALPSIAAVAHVELTTRAADQPVGWRVSFAGGKLQEEREIAAAFGTTVRVKDLFFNTPARRKFLKSPATEQSHCLQTVTWAALAHPDVRFQMSVDGREAFNCPPTISLEDRLTALYGQDRPADLRPVSGERGDCKVSGMIAGPAVSRPTRQGLNLFINGRPIDHRGLYHAVLEAYRHLLPAGRFPVCFLFLTIPPDQVDVNVHPAKREVRLRDEHHVHDMVLSALRAALGEGNLTAAPAYPGVSSGAPVLGGHGAGEAPWSRSRVQESIATYLDAQTPRSSGLFSAPPRPADAVPAAEPRSERLIGQVGRTFIAAQDQDGFYLVDQHAAHERWLYEQLRREAGPLPRQALLLPLTFELAPARAALLTGVLDVCHQLGLEIAAFGRNTFVIQTQPQAWASGDLVAVVNELLDWMAELDRTPVAEDVREKSLQLMACHSAVKAGDRLQPEAMLNLLAQVDAIPAPKTCPHGRPILFRLSWQELDRLFKRT